MYQIISLRYNPQKKVVQHRYHQVFARDYTHLVTARPDLVKLFKETQGEGEDYNLFFTASQATLNDRNDFQSQEIIPFDLDNIDVDHLEDYLDVWTGVTGIAWKKCWCVKTGNGLQIHVRVREFKEEYIQTYKPAYRALCKTLDSAMASVGLKGNTDTTVFCKTQLLRLPGTTNRKPMESPFGADARVRGATTLCKSIEVHEFKWDKWHSQALAKKSKKSKSPEGYAFKPHDINYIFENCDFLAKQMREGGATADYPQWYAALGVTSWLQIQKGEYVESFNHFVSSKHHGYDSEAVDNKVQECLRATGPRTCDSIDAVWSGCSTCKKYSQRHKFATPVNLRPYSKEASEEAIAEFDRMAEAAGFENLAIPLQERESSKDTKVHAPNIEKTTHVAPNVGTEEIDVLTYPNGSTIHLKGDSNGREISEVVGQVPCRQQRDEASSDERNVGPSKSECPESGAGEREPRTTIGESPVDGSGEILRKEEFVDCSSDTEVTQIEEEIAAEADMDIATLMRRRKDDDCNGTTPGDSEGVGEGCNDSCPKEPGVGEGEEGVSEVRLQLSSGDSGVEGRAPGVEEGTGGGDISNGCIQAQSKDSKGRDSGVGRSEDISSEGEGEPGVEGREPGVEAESRSLAGFSEVLAKQGGELDKGVLEENRSGALGKGTRDGKSNNNEGTNGGRSEHRAQDDLRFAKKSREVGAKSGGSEFGDSNLCSGGRTDGRGDHGDNGLGRGTGGSSSSKGNDSNKALDEEVSRALVLAEQAKWQFNLDTGFSKYVEAKGKDGQPTEKFVGRENILLVKYFNYAHHFRYILKMRRFMVYAAGLYTQWEDDAVKGFAQDMFHTPPCEKDLELREFLAKAKSLRNYQIVADEFYSGLTTRGLINCKDFTFDISTKRKLPHSPDRFFTYKLDYNYVENSPRPTWHQIMKNLTGDNQPQIDFIEEFIGYCLANGDYLYKHILVLKGDGDNGKGSLINIIYEILGNKRGSENYSNVDIDSFTKSESFFIAELEGKLANISDDQDRKSFTSKSVTKLKQLSGNSSTPVQHKGEKPFLLNNTAKLIISVNDTPDIAEINDAIDTRFVIIPFNKNFRKKDKHLFIPDMHKKLVEERSGIMAQCVDAYRAVLARGFFTIPQETVEELAKMREFNCPVEQWWADRVTIAGKDFHITSGAAYQNFVDSYVNERAVSLNQDSFVKRFAKKCRNLNISQKRIVDDAGVQTRVWMCLKVEGIHK